MKDQHEQKIIDALTGGERGEFISERTRALVGYKSYKDEDAVKALRRMIKRGEVVATGLSQGNNTRYGLVSEMDRSRAELNADVNVDAELGRIASLLGKASAKANRLTENGNFLDLQRLRYNLQKAL